MQGGYSSREGSGAKPKNVFGVESFRMNGLARESHHITGMFFAKIRFRIIRIAEN
jgi:hypothetical protein